MMSSEQLGLVVLVVLVILSLLSFSVRLRRSENRFRLLAENASDLIAVHDADGTFLWVSPSSERLLGYTPQEMVGGHPQTLAHPDDQVQALGVASGGEAGRVTYRIRRADGFYLWFDTLTQPIRNKQGEVVQYHTASRDVTEQRQSRDLYRFLVQHLPNTAVYLFDRNTLHVIADDVVSERGPVDGLTLWQVFPDDIAMVLAPFYKAVFEGNALRTEQSFRSRTYRITFLPILGDNGEVELGMAVFFDVSEEKARTNALENQTHDLERSNRDLEQFANVASHELKSPLRRIASFADLIAEEHEGLLSDSADEYIGHILEGVRSLSEVIESLLTYSRVQAAESIFVEEDLNAIFDEAVRNLEPHVRDSGAQITRDDLPTRLSLDRTLIRQLFENLICNGIKFNTTGRTPVVHVSVRRELLDWEFSVEDNGPGLDPAYQSKVFSMFQRLRPDVSGSGIGLSLCKKIIDIHRGRIWYEPLVVGTAFKFTLPARTMREDSVETLSPLKDKAWP